MSILTETQLKQIMPSCIKADVWAKALNDALDQFEINTPKRAAVFLAQIAHESGELRRLVENLNYSADRLRQVWPKRFPTLERAKAYEHNPQKLASCVYANRLGNGDEASGDGWKYRGRGLIQLTGRDNYRSVGQALSLPLEAQPELLEQEGSAALSAAYFWKSHGLNELADQETEESFVKITERINGAQEGLNNRRQYWQTARKVLV